MILRQSSIQEFDEVKLGCDYKLAKMAAEVKMIKCGKIPTRVVDACCNATFGFSSDSFCLTRWGLNFHSFGGM